MQEKEIKVPIDADPNAIGLDRLADVTHFIWMLRTNQVKAIIQRQYIDVADNLIKETNKELLADNSNIVDAGSPTLDLLVEDGVILNAAYEVDPSQFPYAIGEYTLFLNMKISDVIPGAVGELADMKISDLLALAIGQQIVVSNSRGNM